MGKGAFSIHCNRRGHFSCARTSWPLLNFGKARFSGRIFDGTNVGFRTLESPFWEAALANIRGLSGRGSSMPTTGADDRLCAKQSHVAGYGTRMGQARAAGSGTRKRESRRIGGLGTVIIPSLLSQFEFFSVLISKCSILNRLAWELCSTFAITDSGPKVRRRWLRDRSRSRLNWEARVMPSSPKEFREFAQECLRWADETNRNGTDKYCEIWPQPGCKRHCSLNVAWH